MGQHAPVCLSQIGAIENHVEPVIHSTVSAPVGLKPDEEQEGTASKRPR